MLVGLWGVMVNDTMGAIKTNDFMAEIVFVTTHFLALEKNTLYTPFSQIM